MDLILSFLILIDSQGVDTFFNTWNCIGWMYIKTHNISILFLWMGSKKNFFYLLGPPGTGKTVVGVQIMKVFLAKENRKADFGPILVNLWN